MKTTKDTLIKFKSKFGGLVGITVPKGADIKNLVTNILLIAPPEDAEEVLGFINDLIVEIKENRLNDN